MFSPTDFFQLSSDLEKQLFASCTYAWEALQNIEVFLKDLLKDQQVIHGIISPGAYLSDRPLYIAEGAVIEPGAYVIGPAYIGPGVVIRHGAYVRENIIMFKNSLLGHTSEAKNSIFLENAHAPHFNYVGDSILGKNVNLGAGTKLSNLALISEKDPVTGKRPTITFQHDGINYDTNLVKLGAILGDNCQTGCNSVLNPGCIVGPNTLIYANLSLRKGYHPAGSIIKLRQQTSVIPRKKLNEEK